MKNKTKYFLDTNVFDKLLLQNIQTEVLLANGIYFSSNVQLSELKNITNTDKRDKLLTYYYSLQQEKLLLQSGIWLDALYWDDEQPWIDEINETAQNLSGKSVKTWQDALIGEIAKLNNLVLVTCDLGFINKAKCNDIKAITCDIFISTLTKIKPSLKPEV